MKIKKPDKKFKYKMATFSREGINLEARDRADINIILDIVSFPHYKNVNKIIIHLEKIEGGKTNGYERKKL